MKICGSFMALGMLTLGAGVYSIDSALAEESHWYLGFNTGQAKYDISQDDLDEFVLAAFDSAGITVLDAESSFDDKGTPWSIVGGWKFSKYFAAEVGYLNLGKAEYSAEGTVFVPGFGIFDSTFDMDISAKGPTAALVGIAPIGEKFDFHAKAGMFFAKTKFDFTLSDGSDSASDSFDASSNDMFYGVGAAYHFTDRISATVDYLLYKDVGDKDETGESDVDSITLGIIFRM